MPLYYGKSIVGNVGVGFQRVASSDDPVLQDKVFDKNGTYFADFGYDGFGEITIAVPSEELPTAEGVEF